MRLLGFEPAAWAEYKHGSLESAGDTLAAPSPTASPPQHSERDADDEVSLSKAAERSSSSGSGSGSATASTSSASRRLPLHRPPWKYDAPELDGVKGTTIEGIMKADVWSLGVMLTVLLRAAPAITIRPVVRRLARTEACARIADRLAADDTHTRAGETSSSTGTTPAGSSAQPPLSVYLPTGMSAAPTAVPACSVDETRTPAERPSASVVKSGRHAGDAAAVVTDLLVLAGRPSCRGRCWADAADELRDCTEIGPFGLAAEPRGQHATARVTRQRRSSLGDMTRRRSERDRRASINGGATP